jgi:hypothetical protein
MKAIIVSDLHIGSRYFLYDNFERFLGNVSEDYELILNGDIIDNPYEKLKPPISGSLTLLSKNLTVKRSFGFGVTMIMDICQKGLRKSTLHLFTT